MARPKEIEVKLHTFLLLILDGTEWSVSCVGYFRATRKMCKEPLTGELYEGKANMDVK
jgi:hypothetical protein